MLELFILNPGRPARSRDAPKKRKRKSPKRRAKSTKHTTVKRKKRKRVTKSSRMKENSMAKRRTRRRPARKGRRRMRRNAWYRQKADHGTAAELGWAYKTRGRRRRRKGGSPRRYIRSKMGIRRLASFRKRHPVSKRRKSRRRMISFRPKAFGRRYTLAANRRRRYSNNPVRRRRRRRPSARARNGRFVSAAPRRRRRRRSTRKGMVRRTARRAYRRNWFVYDDNPPRRRRRRKASSRKRRRRTYRRNAGRRYMSNPMADALATITSPFDIGFLTSTALPVAGGFLGTRAVSAFIVRPLVGNLGLGYTGVVQFLGSLLSAGITGAIVGFGGKMLGVKGTAEIAGNVVLGGVVGSVAGLVTDLASGVDFIAESPVLSEAFGLAGLGMVHEDVRRAVESEVMRELGVSDYLTAQQLTRAERIGDMDDYLTTQQLSRAENIGQYPAETAGYQGPSYSTEGPIPGVGQYPLETSGGAMADFADVAAFGG